MIKGSKGSLDEKGASPEGSGVSEDGFRKRKVDQGQFSDTINQGSDC